jgi:hypothetical protein
VVSSETAIAATTTSTSTDSDDDDGDSEGWVALEDLPLYTSSDPNSHFLEDGTESKGKTTPPLPSQTWRADFDDLKPCLNDTAVPFDLTSIQLDAVKAGMQNISLEYKPEWAEVVKEEAWQQQLQKRLLQGRQDKD